MGNRFEGQVAIVTGGADGIGRSIALRLAREGALVTIFDINLQNAEATAGEFAESGISIDYEIVDISSKRQVKSAVGSVVARNGGNLDIMVNCAGIVGPTSTPVDKVSISDFDRVFAINVRGTFLMTRYSIKAMKKNGYGRILNFASIAGKEGNAGMSPYSASKAAVIGLVKSVGKEYATSGITINAIAPAVIRTPMVEAIHPEQIDYMTSRIPMGRCGTLDEIASLSCWIVSPESSFNTGFTFDLSGGRAVY
ncbi:MAG: SDR family NAD(P)-dependent oxidoreductase [Verrucomicrobiales bacterium]|nr:SDR family NAD(P)-dependent oxidoreductase [Verrucomicrobiales bacterium]